MNTKLACALILLLLLASLGAAARAQPAAPSSDQPAVQQEGKPNQEPAAGAAEPGAKEQTRGGRAGGFSLEVRSLDIDNLLKLYSDTFRLTVVKDPNCTGPVTVICPQPVTEEEALSILNGVLEVRGFTSLLTGSLLKIVPLARAVQSRVNIRVGTKADPLALDQVMTQMVPLQQAQASALQRELTPLLSPGASIIASPASNMLIITDTGSNVTRLLEIIERLDSKSPNGTKVFTLEYADASSLAPIISQLVLTAATGGATAATTRAVPWEQRLRGRGFATPSAAGVASYGTASQGMVLAETRTNSLIVTASPDKMQTAETVIKSLDKLVPYESTVYVFALQHAKALDLASTLNQAFGRAAGTARTATTTTTQRSYQGTRSTQPGLRGTSGSGQSSQAPEEAPMVASAAAVEETPTRQAQQGQSTTGGYTAPRTPARTTTTTGRTAEGRVVNVLGTGDVTIIPEPNSNSLIINAPPEQMAVVKGLVQELDQVPVQVMIEAVIAEVTLDATSKLGFEWTWTEANHWSQGQDVTGKVQTNFGLNDPKALGLRYSVVAKSLSTLLTALATDQRAKILSTPRIFTSNNRPAEINISQQVPYIISFRETDQGTLTYNYGYMDVGIVLQVTPQVSSNGTVNLEVSQEANDLLGYTSFNAPIVARRSAQTSVSIQDGHTVVLGGIMKDSRTETVTKVPLLGDLPILGSLFRKKEVSKGKTELLVFLTPRVVRSPEEASALTREQQDKLKGIDYPVPLVPPGLQSAPPPVPEGGTELAPGQETPGEEAPGGAEAPEQAPGQAEPPGGEAAPGTEPPGQE